MEMSIVETLLMGSLVELAAITGKMEVPMKVNL
jgi:hypothetical protein